MRAAAAHPLMARAITLARAFATVVREQRHEQLDSWMEQATLSDAGALRNFVLSLRQDEAAV